jgi:hypothetical protein
VPASPRARSHSPGVVGSPAERCQRPVARPVGHSGAIPIAIPLRLKSGLFSREVDPLQSHVSRLPGVVTPGPAPTRFRAPSTASLRLAPCTTGSSTPAAVPLSGFHSLPAVCQHTRASRPCFMPQTVRGVLPSERCSSLGSRAPLGAALLPCGSSSQYLRCDARGLVLQVSPDWPRLHVVRLGSPWSSRAVSGRPKPVFPDALGPAHRDHPVPAPTSASKPSSPRESVLTTAGCPTTTSRCSPGFPPLQSLEPT